MPAPTRNRRYGEELVRSRKILGPMPPLEFLATFLPQKPDQSPAGLNIFADVVYESDRQLAKTIIEECAAADFIDITNTMDSAPQRKIYGVRDRADAVVGSSGGLCYRTLKAIMEFKPHKGEYNFGSDSAPTPESVDDTSEVMAVDDGSQPPADDHVHVSMEDCSAPASIEDKDAPVRFTDDAASAAVDDRGTSTPSEPKFFLKSSKKAYDCLGQMAKYALLSVSYRSREFLYTVYLRGLKARLLRWDSSGAIISGEFDIALEDHLSVFYHRLSQATPSEQGFDTTIRDVTDDIEEPRYAQAKAALQEWASQSKRLDQPLVSKALYEDSQDQGIRWLVVEVPSLNPQEPTPIEVLCRDLHKGGGELFSRGTRTLPGAILSLPENPTTSDKDSLPPPMSLNQIVLVKDSWRPKNSAKEWEILQKLNKLGVPHIPTVLAGDEVRSGEASCSSRLQQTRTSDFATSEWNRCADPAVETKVHQRFVQAEIGIPLGSFTKPQDIFQAVLAALEAHKSALSHGWLHRDISYGNVLIYLVKSSSSKEGPKWSGMLIDWEYAHDVNAQTASQIHRTGTYSFMSRKLLQGSTDYDQNVTDDLESFFWVIIYTCLRYLKTQETRIKQDKLALFMWTCFYEDWKTDPFSGKQVGGDSRARFVSEQAFIPGLGALQWTHQPAIRGWMKKLINALVELTNHHRHREELLLLLQTDPNLDHVKPTALSDLGYSSKDSLLKDLRKLSSPGGYVPGGDLASHDWFMETLRSALREEEGHPSEWNTGIILDDQGEAAEVEGPKDLWSLQRASSSNKRDGSSRPAATGRSSDQTKPKGKGKSQTASGGATILVASNASERARKRRKPNEPES